MEMIQEIDRNRQRLRPRYTIFANGLGNYDGLVQKLYEKGLIGHTEMEDLVEAETSIKRGTRTWDILLGRMTNEMLSTFMVILEEVGDQVLGIVIKEVCPDLHVGCRNAPAARKFDGWFDVGEIAYRFTGREDERKRVHERLTVSHTTKSVIGNITCICGLGGIGKSSLARQYAHDYREFYDGNVLWINADTLTSMRDSFLRLAALFHIEIDPAQARNKEIAEIVYNTYSSKKCLFVFDNVENEEDFAEFKPTIANPAYSTPYVLITSRRIDMRLFPQNQLPLQELTVAEAIDFIQHELLMTSKESAEKLAERLHGLPLALQQAVAFVRQKYLTPSNDRVAKYLTELVKSERTFLERFRNADECLLITFRVCQMAMKRIQGMDAGAAKLVHILSCLNPVNISVQFLNKVFNGMSKSSLDTLKSYSMISVDLAQESIGIHHLVQKVIRMGTSSEEELNILLDLMKALKIQLTEFEYTDLRRECMLHGLHLFKFQSKHDGLMKDNSDYLSNLCNHLRLYGNHSEALSIAQQSTVMYEGRNGTTHPSTIIMKWRVAEAHHMMGNLSETLHILESVLPVSEIFLDHHNHELLVRVLGSVARDLAAQGNVETAVRMYDAIISLKMAVNKEEDQVLLTYRNHTAEVLLNAGKLDEALKRFQYVYDNRLRLYGTTDLNAVTERLGIARIHHKKGNLSEALEMYKEIYDIGRELLGENRQETVSMKHAIQLFESPWMRNLPTFKDALNAKSEVSNEIMVKSNHASTSSSLRSQPRESSVWFNVGAVTYNFIGREKELAILETLSNTRSNESIMVNIVCITGLGGVGKSELARKYAYTYRKFYEGNVMWIHAETTDSMRSSFSRLAKLLDVRIDDDTPSETIALNVYEKFRDKRSLFIFDDVEELEDFRQFRPQLISPHFRLLHILITSRRNDLTLTAARHQLSLDVLTLEEAVQFIQQQLPQANFESAERLADKLQRFPLALQQAVAFIYQRYLRDEKCIDKYLNEFADCEINLLDDRRFQIGSDYSSTTFTTWKITLDRIRMMEDGESAINSVKILSYLNPDNISKDILSKVLRETEKEIEAYLNLLARYSMINVNGDIIRIHRLVQQVIRMCLGFTEEVYILGSIITVLESQLNSSEYTDFTRECTSHGLHLLQFQLGYEVLMKDRSKYFSDLCFYAGAYGNYTEALTTSQKMAEVYERLKGADNVDALRMKWRMGEAQYDLQNYLEALRILVPTCEIAKFRLGSDHGLTVTLLSSLAKVYSTHGDEDMALEIYDEIIPSQVQIHGEESPNVLIHKTNKAVTLSKLGRLDEALELFRHVYQKNLRLHGENDMNITHTRYCMAGILREKGELISAFQMYKQVYETWKKVLGADHAHTNMAKGKVDELEAKLKDKRQECIIL